jgi:hypothetical protein
MAPVIDVEAWLLSAKGEVLNAAVGPNGTGLITTMRAVVRLLH